MPVAQNDNICPRIDRFDEKTVVFVTNAMNATASAHSLAALMNGLSKKGYTIHLITSGAPAGDDYITADNVIRHALNRLENDGVNASLAMLRVLGAIPAKTVILWGTFNARTYQRYLAAKSLGRCVILYQTQSPCLPVSSGPHSLIAMYNNCVAGCDAVITPSRKDAEMFAGLGAGMQTVIPFYLPYDSSEVSPSTVENRQIAFFSSFAGRNTKNILAAFALLLQKYPDAKMHMILLKSVKSKASSDAMMDYVKSLNLGESLEIERMVLKPLRQLRTAGISITYAHYEHMPQTVMESLAAGIPAILATDGDYAGDCLPVEEVNAADVSAIYRLLEKYMEEEARLAFRDTARKGLEAETRQAIVAQWCDAVDAAEAAFDARVAKAAAVSKLTEQALLADDPAALGSLMLEQGATAADLFGACLMQSMTKEATLAAFCKFGAMAGNRADEVEERFRYLNVMEEPLKKGLSPEDAVLLSDKAIYTGFELQAMLCQCGVKPEEIIRAFGIPNLDIFRAVCAESLNLLNCLYNNDVRSDPRVYQTENSSVLTYRNAQRYFLHNNNNALKFKGHSLVSRTLRLTADINSPWDFKSPLQKLLCAPFFLRTLLRRKLILMGKRRQNRRKVVEVDSGDTRKIQLLVMLMLLELDRICKKYDLTYYLAGGSILGGIRHKGFIPWDDDIDITMPRPDYDKFIRVAQKELPEEFYLDKDCVPFCHNRIEIKGTVFHSFWRNGGIFLDILALEGSPEDEGKRLQHEMKCKFWRAHMLEKARPFPVFDLSTKEKFKHYIYRSILLFVPRSFLKHRWEHWAKKYSTAETDSWVCLPASIYTYEQERFPKEYWDKPVPMEFEGMMLPTMAHWEDYLICHFGDYMKLPPETSRKSHHYIYEYSLGKYGDMSVEELEELFQKKKEAHFGTEESL